MRRIGALLAVTGMAVLAVGTRLPEVIGAAQPARLQVAVVNADLAAIVDRVGRDDVVTTSLFQGCVLRKGLEVEPASLDRLFAADALVWSGLFHESAAIHAAVERLPSERQATLSRPLWIDVSHDAARVNLPTSSCEGFVEIQFMHGDPFFWLNPENGAVIARNVAAGLGQLRPERAAMYAANADAFADEMAGSIARWRQELAPLTGLKVFVAQCGWANLARVGGPALMSCRKSPGTLERPEALAEQIDDQGVEIVVVDPNTPPEYAETFRRLTSAKVVVIPSSIGDLPGARGYPALFDNLIEQLRAVALASPAAPPAPTEGSQDG